MKAGWKNDWMARAYMDAKLDARACVPLKVELKAKVMALEALLMSMTRAQFEQVMQTMTEDERETFVGTMQ